MSRLHRTLAVARKELAATLGSPMGLVVLVVFCGYTSWATLGQVEESGEASLRPFFQLLPIVLSFVAPAISMRLLSEERKLGTLELLLTWPLEDWEIVIGKHLGALAFLELAVLVTALPLWAFVAAFGDVDPGPVLGGLAGGFFLGAAYLAIGLLASSLAENQVVAFVLSVVLIVPLWLLGTDVVRVQLDPAWLPLADSLALSRRFEAIARGVLDLRDIVYFFVLVVVFLAATARVLGARRFANRLQPLDALLATALTLLVGGVLVATADELPLRKDLTRDKVYSLSRATTQVLDSLEDPCEIVGYFSAKLPAQMRDRRRRVLDLLSEVEAASRGKVRFVERDPQDPEVAAVVSRLGIQRTVMTQRARGEVQAIEGYFALALLYRDRREVIPFVGEPRDLELDLDATLRALDLPRPRTVGVLVPRLPARPSAAQRLVVERLQERRFDVIWVHPGEPFPRMDALVVIDPKKLSERDAYEVDQTALRGAGVLVVADSFDVDLGLSAHARPTGLEGVLDAWSAPLGRGVVRERAKGREDAIHFTIGNKPVEGPCPFAPNVARAQGGISDHAIAGVLDELSFPFAAPIVPGAPPSGVTLSVLAHASDEADVRDRDGALWGEIEKFVDAVAKGEPLPARSGPGSPALAVALRGALASAWKGRPVPPLEAATVAQLQAAPSDALPETADEAPVETAKDARVVVIGAPSMLDPDVMRCFPGGMKRLEKNLAFVSNAVDWLLDEPDLIPLRGRDLVERSLRAEDTPRKRGRAGVLVVPFLIALLGLAGHALERKRRSQASARLRAALSSAREAKK